ncbi:MAG: TonB-dependent receptor [Bacteroidota bacterium]
MKKLFFLLLCLQGTIPIFSQEQKVFTPEGDTSLPEVLISTTRFPEKKKNVVQKVQVITRSAIAAANTQNTGDLLQNTGNVYVQKSQQGGSSPVVRGFEASRVLLEVDGIRMNNAIYRSGHLQNAITVDQNMLERVEVMFGPGSTMHGSDALGGVVAFKTRDPLLAVDSGKTIFNGGAFMRYSSANNEKTGHADINLGNNKLGLLLSGTFSDFGDLKMGDNYTDKYPDFGRRKQYVSRINGVDSIFENPDDRVQKFSAYHQYDILAKLLYKPNEKISHLLNFQFSNTNNVPRYDRLQDIRNNRLRYAEWYYGPQKRNLYSYQLLADLNGFFKELKITASYQQIEESRHQRDRGNNRRQNRIETLNVGGLTADLRKIWGNHELHLGIDMQLNDVKSKAFGNDIVTGTITPLDTRYPEKNSYNTFGIYAQHFYKFKSTKLVLNDGIRVQGSWLHSTILDQSTSFRPFTELKQNPIGVSGNMGLVYMPNAGWRFTGGINTGFRAPNIDDLTKIFESSTASSQIVVANPDIKPEYTVNAEIGIEKRFGKWVRIEASAFYTRFLNAIVKAPFTINEQDSIIYDGNKYQVLAAQNEAKAYLYGASGSISVIPINHLTLMSTINYTYGRYFRADNSKIPLDHVPPVFGKTSLQYATSKWSAECWLMYNGWKKIEQYNPDGEDNAQYATPEGMPSWTTVNIKAQYYVSKNLTMQAAVENITDRNYRTFASGFSSPGRSFIIALRSYF